ncbi:MAG TPA: hypothetical protein VIN03_17800 [Roseateles sp.]
MKTSLTRVPWNKGRLVGQKAPLRANEIWAIRFDLQQQQVLRQLALFDLAFGGKLRGFDLVALRVGAICHGGRVLSRASGGAM